MKLLSLSIYTFSSPAQATLVSQASDLSEYSFLTRGSVQEGLNFLSSTVASRTTDGQRQSVQEGQNMANVYRKGNIAAVLISDTAYPVRVSFSLLNKILDEYTSDHWTKAVGDSKLAEYVRKYQDPKQADTIMKVQQELDETKIVLHKTIESVLERGEKLDNLVERSNALSAQSKMFYKTAKKQNSCCIVM
ncbi:snare protein ykt6 [Phaffia rhodozyma]|uniref:Synaptobrevin homolog YKT6 n=1 Tax=Phaffia rhodozyma TaxID=264483 RepID=A0A0F7SPF2_PHARH|nr:snare protein ykt6 [Phaffia rhodozyma]